MSLQENIESILIKLIEIPSATADLAACREIIDHTERALVGLPLHIQTDFGRDHPWLLATTRPGMTPRILLCAHLDAVPASHPDQYQPKLEGDRLYGRGSYDMKFAAACFIELLHQQADNLGNMDFGVLFTTDEEQSGQSVADLTANGLRPEITIIPDSSRAWQIEHKAKGLLIAKLTAHGRNAHSSRPWEGENALTTLLSALQVLRQDYQNEDRMAPTLSLNRINTDEKGVSQLPDTASAVLDFRAFERDAIESYRQQLTKLSKEHGLTLETQAAGDPVNLDQSNPLVQRFFDVYEQKVGPLAFNEAFGTTDGRHFAHYDIPAIVISIRGNDFHGPEEWIDRRDLVPFYGLVESYILQQAAA